MVLVGEPTFPGCVIEVRAIAVLRMADDKGQDDKIVCVPYEDPHWSGLEDLDDIPAQLRARDRALLLDLQAAGGQGRRHPGLRGLRRALALIEGSRATCSVAAIGADRRQQVLAGREAAHVLRTRLARSRSIADGGLATCGVISACGEAHSGWPSGSGSGSVTSSAAPPMIRARERLRRARRCRSASRGRC